jgi:hypothetical protein
MKGTVLRKLALLAHIIALLFLAHFAAAQQVDLMVGGGTLMQPYTSNSSQSFTQIAETGGTYLSVGADYIDKDRRLGLNLESSWRYHPASYYGYETYRPILTDINVVFQPKLNKKFGLDFMAGIGADDTRFDLPTVTTCGHYAQGGCVYYTSTDHFMEHFSGGLRYYFWHNVFVRPEANIYHIHGNTNNMTGGFNSDFVTRVGASIGYTFGR